MADIRLGIDPSGAVSGAQQIRRELQGLLQAANETRQAFASIQGAGTGAGGANSTNQVVAGLRQQADATKSLIQVQKQQAQVVDQVMRTRREELGAVQKIITGLASEEAAQRKAAQSLATFLSTLGGASRAASQYAVAISRINRAEAEGLVTAQQANFLREKAARTFTTANINAKDLRLNMQGLNQSFQVLASVLSRVDPLLGATVGSLLRAGQAAGKLSGGFILLGPIAALLGTIAAGFTAIAVAGDRTASIPGHLSRIKDGLRELVSRLSEKIDATGTVGWFLTKVEEWLPATTGNRIDDLRNHIKDLEAELAKVQASGRPLAGPNANIPRELATARRDLFILEEQARRNLVLGIDKEAAAQEELRKKLNDLLDAKIKHKITDEEYLHLLGELNKQEKQRVESLKENREAQREQNAAAREAAEIAKAYKDAIAGLRAEEEAATANEVKRLEELRLSNDLLAKRIAAVNQGTDAVKANNIEEAKALEIQRQRESKANLSGPESQALIDAAARHAELQNQLDDQKKLADQTDKVWDNAIDNIQQGFGDLFTNILVNGKDAFGNLGDFVKNLFSRTLAEIGNAAVFKPFFDALKGTGASGAQGSTNPLQALLGIQNSVTAGVTHAFRQLGNAFGNLTGLAGTANAFGAVGNVVGGAGLGFGLSQLLLGAVLSQRRQQSHSTGILAGAGAGAVGGAILGSIIPGVGTAIGAIVGAIAGGVIGAFAGGSGGSTALQLRTLRQNTFIRDNPLIPRPERPRNTFVVGEVAESPFGFLGAIGAGTGGRTRDLNATIRSVGRFDAQLNSFLTTVQTQSVAAFLNNLDEKFSNTRDPQKIFRKRATDALVALGFPANTGDDVFAGVTKAEGAKGIADAFGNLVNARKAMLDLIADLKGTAPPANDAAVALDKLNNDINQLRINAPDLGITIDNFAELQAQALKRFTDDFNKSISDQILGATNPGVLLIRAEQEAAEKRVREAQTAGANLVEVERLNAIKRAQVLEEANQPITDLIRQIQLSPSGSSPTAALGTAESRFFSLVSSNTASREQIASAAQSFLGLGEQFLGGPTFAAKRDLVLNTLESLLLTMPGTAADTGEQLQGLNLETARGNAANEQLLGRLIDENSAMRNEIVLLNSKLDRVLAK